MEGPNLKQPQEDEGYIEYTIAEIINARKAKKKLDKLDPEALKDALYFMNEMEGYSKDRNIVPANKDGSPHHRRYNKKDPKNH